MWAVAEPERYVSMLRWSVHQNPSQCRHVPLYDHHCTVQMVNIILSEQRIRQNEDIPNTVGPLLLFTGKKVLSRAKTLISIWCSYTLSTGNKKRAPWPFLTNSAVSKSRKDTEYGKVEALRKKESWIQWINSEGKVHPKTGHDAPKRG